jgi:hypothetical protein
LERTAFQINSCAIDGSEAIPVKEDEKSAENTELKIGSEQFQGMANSGGNSKQLIQLRTKFARVRQGVTWMMLSLGYTVWPS